MDQAKLYSECNALQKADARFVLDRYFHLVRWRKNEPRETPNQEVLLEEEVRRRFARLDLGEESVLDVGCGDGNVTVDLLLPRVPEDVKSKVLGVDVSMEMVRFARDNNRIGGRVDYRVMDVEGEVFGDGGFEKEAFDHVVSFYCLHWVQNQKRCFENLFALLKPTGDLLITFLAKNPIYTVYNNLSKNNRWSQYMRDVKKFLSPYHDSEDPEKELHKLMADTGFKVNKCELIDRTYVFHDLNMWRKSVIAVNPFLSRIPKPLIEDYIDDFFKEVRKLNCIIRNENNNEEKVETKYQLFVVYATK